MRWLRRLLSPECRGTLTLLDVGMIFGPPSDWDLTPAEAARLFEFVREWLASDQAKPLILPWPVDVADHRGKP